MTENWQYRVTSHTDHQGQPVHEIRRVYYDQHGIMTAMDDHAQVVATVGDHQQLVNHLVNMMAAVSQPVIPLDTDLGDWAEKFFNKTQ